jgi:hypothetical protein
MRASGLTKSGDPGVVTLETNCSIARLDVPLFQD